MQAHTGQYPPFDNFVTGSMGDPVKSITKVDDDGNKVTTNYYDITESSCSAVNLGLIVRPTADAAIREDLYKAAVKINGKTATYDYDIRNDYNNEDLWEIEVRRSDLNEFYGEAYNREILEPDKNYTNSDKSKELQVFVTYKIAVRNQSPVDMKINEIVSHYDKDYVLRKDLSWIDATNRDYLKLIAEASLEENERNAGISGSNQPNGKYNSSQCTIGEDYKEFYITSLAGDKINTGGTRYIFLTFEVPKDTITKESTAERKNFVEITSYSTYYPDDGTITVPNWEQTKVNGSVAGLLDVDSIPGNYNDEKLLENPEYVEDDADRGKGIKIYIDDDTVRKITGTVWKDERVETVEKAKIGNGIFDRGESGVKDVTITLYEIDNDDIGAENPTLIEAKTWNTPEGEEVNITTGENGEYTIEGFVPGNYIVRFVYPNGQDYKSTIYQKGLAQNGTDPRHDGKTVSGYKADNDQDRSGTYGYNISIADSGPRVSDAKDIWTEREKVNKYGDNIENGVEKGVGYTLATKLADTDTNTKMTAETGVIRAEVEYNTETIGSTPTGVIAGDSIIKNLDFGIVERPRAGLKLDKKVSNIKIALADGRTLVDTNKSVNNVIWTAKGDALYGGLVQVIVDEEIMHGATIQVTYDIQGENVGEYDYKDKEFYYLGVENNPKGNIIKSSVDTVIDYVSNNLQFRAGDNNGWEVVEDKDSLDVSNDVKNQLGKYNTIITTQSLKKKIAPTEKTDIFKLTLTKLVTSSDDYQFTNIAEILNYSNDVGRRLQTPKNLGEEGKKVIPGNQDPTQDPAEIDSSRAEPISIVPPYGQVHLYFGLGIGIAALLIVAIIIIKKKVLRKE